MSTRTSSSARTLGADAVDDLLAELKRRKDDTRAKLRGAADDSVLSSGESVAHRLRETWRTLVASGGAVSKNYIHQLVERIEVHENEIRIVARPQVASS